MIPLAQALADAVAALAAAGVPSPRTDAELLAAHVLGLGRGALQARSVAGALVLDDGDAAAYRELVARRADREPLQHLTGVAHFRGLTLSVGPGVFVPRPETETVAQFAIDALAATPIPERPALDAVEQRGGEVERAAASPRAVDLGTGSGALAIALATEVPHSEVWAVEISPDAFVWAKLNARANGAANVHLVLDDLATALPELDGTIDVVVSNPPYIPVGMVPRDPEVRRFDPELALYGGQDGLDVLRALERTAHRLLHEGGTLVVEHAEIQGDPIRELLAAAGWRAPQTHPDLTGRPRTTVAIR